ncbi:unnamed protein product [Camellia sinensis]
MKISVKVLSLSFQAGLVERDKLSEDFIFRVLPAEMRDASSSFAPTFPLTLQPMCTFLTSL